MYFLLIRYFLLQLIISSGDNTSFISEEYDDLVKDVAQEPMDFISHRSNRRVQEDLDDKEWHVAHLRDGGAGFSDVSCRRLTFNERVGMYKRVLNEDGSRVKFVSSDPIPPDGEIKIFNDSCSLTNDTRVDEDENKRVTDSVTNTTVIEAPLDLDRTLDSDMGNSSKATTAAVKKNLTGGSKSIDNVTATDEKIGWTSESGQKHGKHKRRHSQIRREGEDYQFSSVEYYDELLDFDESKCPDDVKVITLQIDQLRAYDIECEVMIEWRSLE